MVEVAQSVVDGHALLPRDGGIEPFRRPAPRQAARPLRLRTRVQALLGRPDDGPAAALTYYSLLSLFPALLFGVAALGYFGRQQLIADASNYLLEAGAPKETVSR